MESVVVDTNKVLAAFIKRDIVNDLLFSGKFKPIAPRKLVEEVREHKGDIVDKSGIKPEDVELAVDLLEFEFDIFEREKYSDKLAEALEIAPHSKDAEFFALALEFGFPIWSNEEAFRKQSRVRIFSTKELAKFLGLK